MRNLVLRIQTDPTKPQVGHPSAAYSSVLRLALAKGWSCHWYPRRDDTEMFVIGVRSAEQAEINAEEVRALVLLHLEESRFGIYNGEAFTLLDRNIDKIEVPHRLRFEVHDTTGYLNSFATSIEAAQYAGNPAATAIDISNRNDASNRTPS